MFLFRSVKTSRLQSGSGLVLVPQCIFDQSRFGVPSFGFLEGSNSHKLRCLDYFFYISLTLLEKRKFRQNPVNFD